MLLTSTNSIVYEPDSVLAMRLTVGCGHTAGCGWRVGRRRALDRRQRGRVRDYLDTISRT